MTQTKIEIAVQRSQSMIPGTFDNIAADEPYQEVKNSLQFEQ